jgi:hypothetical protein
MATQERDWLAELQKLLAAAPRPVSNPKRSPDRLDSGLRKLDAALAGSDSETDTAFRATLELYRLQLEGQRAEIKGLRTELSRAGASAEGAEHAAEQRWRGTHEEAAAAVAKERERGAAARREARALREGLGGTREELEAERQAHEHAAVRLASLEAQAREGGRRAREQHALVARLRMRLGREQEWRAAVLQWLRCETRAQVSGSAGVAQRNWRRRRRGTVNPLWPLPVQEDMQGLQESYRADAAIRCSGRHDGASRCRGSRPSSAPACRPPHSRVCGGLSPAAPAGAGPAGWRHDVHTTMRAYDRHHRELQAVLDRLHERAAAGSEAA